MSVVFEKTPGETIGFGFGDQFRKPVHEIHPIIVGPEYFPPFDPPDDHMMQRPRRVYSRFPWHYYPLPHLIFPVKHEIMDVPIVTTYRLLSIV
jgi:hypothetical protein